MAYPTAHQWDVMADLVKEYGEPKGTMIEFASEPHGIVWLAWDSRLGERNLFILPNGERLSWRPLI